MTTTTSAQDSATVDMLRRVLRDHGAKTHFLFTIYEFQDREQAVRAANALTTAVAEHRAANPEALRLRYHQFGAFLEFLPFR